MPLNRVITGRPTGPQVEKLMAAIGKDLKRGDSITKERISEIIGEKADEPRWRTVVNAWRKKLLTDKGVYLEAVSGVGFKACLAADQIGVTGKFIRAGSRKIFRGLVVAEATPPLELDEDGRRRRDHILSRGKFLLDGVRAEARALSLTLPMVEKRS